MRLERAAKASPALRREAWQTFSGGMARHLVWEALRAQARGHTRQAAENLLTSLRLLPLAVLRMPFDWTRARAMLGRLGRVMREKRG
jgi:hypothetical protein